MYRLKRSGLKMQPWRTPLACILKRLCLRISNSHETWIELCRRGIWLSHKNFLQHLIVAIYWQAHHAQSESKAFLKSTKQAYPFSWWQWTYLSINVRSARTWSAIRLFGKKPIWELWSMFNESTCSIGLWFKIEQNNFPKQLGAQIPR